MLLVSYRPIELADRPRGILDDRDLLRLQVHRRVTGRLPHAIVQRKTTHVNLALGVVRADGRADQPVESRRGLLIVLEKPRVRVHRPSEALANDRVGAIRVEGWVELSAPRPLNAMVVPEDLRPARELNDVEVFL